MQFWNELCGTGLAQSLGITQVSPQSLQRFDAAYLEMYPYLERYIPVQSDLAGRALLEIGLGYGTLSQVLASRGCLYHGVDIAPGPVRMVKYRLSERGIRDGHVQVASALALPFPSGRFDFLFTIGCLHHTGNLPAAVAEVHRVLRPGGLAVVMLYNRYSFRQFVQITWRRLRSLHASRQDFERKVRQMYDANTQGEAAPHTDYVSPLEARRLFKQFSRVQIEAQNMDPIVRWGRLLVPREKLLNNLGRIAGLDLYIRARK